MGGSRVSNISDKRDHFQKQGGSLGAAAIGEHREGLCNGSLQQFELSLRPLPSCGAAEKGPVLSHPFLGPSRLVLLPGSQRPPCSTSARQHATSCGRGAGTHEAFLSLQSAGTVQEESKARG